MASRFHTLACHVWVCLRAIFISTLNQQQKTILAYPHFKIEMKKLFTEESYKPSELPANF